MERSKAIFEKGLMFARNHIQNEVEWFEAAIAETEAWLKLKNNLIKGLQVESFSEVVPLLEKARFLYEKSGDFPSRDFAGYWVDLFNALKSGVLTDCTLHRHISQYIERDSPRAIRRKKIVDQIGTFNILKPLLIYNELERVAQVFETGLNSLLRRYCEMKKKLSLDTSIKIARVNVKPSPKLEWLVKNNTKKKHFTRKRMEKKQHIMEIDKDSELLENMEDEIDTYLALLEEKLK